MRKRLAASALAAVGWMVAATPLMAQNREHQQLAVEVRLLQEQTQHLAVALATLTEVLEAINGRIDEADDANLRRFADQKLIIDNVANDVRVMRERTDDTHVRIAALREELEAVRTSVLVIQQAALAPPPPPIPVDSAEPGEPADPGAPGDTAAATPVAPPPPIVLPPTLGLSPTRMFDTAEADYFAGQYSLAITGFETFLKSFPRSESAGEAQLYIGECYASQSQWAEALAAYNLVVQNYPTSSAVPDAYYRRGLAQERLGQIEAARESWETAVNNFPDSDGGRLARQTLERIGRQQEP